MRPVPISAIVAHKAYYFGYKLHAVCTPKGSLKHSVFPRHLLDAAAIRLETPMRHNQLDYKPFNPLLRKTRKRIETLFSQPCDQFMIRRNYAKSFQGLATSVLSKLTSLSLIQWLNRRNGTRLNNLKIGVT